MATNPWAAVNSGAWASQVDEEEAAGTLGNPLAAPEEAFPDLAVAATKKQSKRDKGKKQTVSLAEFQTGKKAYAPPTRGRTAAKEEIVLPSGPRARDDDDDGNSRGGLGGAFAGRDYKDKGDQNQEMSPLRSLLKVSSIGQCVQLAGLETGTTMMVASLLDAKTTVRPEPILQTAGVERRNSSLVGTQALAAGTLSSNLYSSAACRPQSG